MFLKINAMYIKKHSKNKTQYAQLNKVLWLEMCYGREKKGGFWHAK